MLTVADYFCGAGGSSSGMEAVPGVRVRIASNHWQMALDTHNANMPHVDHDRADIFGIDPASHPHTDLGWFSPECTTWSIARGEAVDYDVQQGDLFDEEPLATEATQRSRLQMDEVVRFVRHHHYRGFIVENVGDILKWWDLDRWLRELVAEGYAFKVVTLNSAFAQALGAPAPQLRDRVYFVFWQTRYRAPDLDKFTRPRAWCPKCEKVVTAVYAPKPGPRRPMRYGGQYVFRCPSVACRNAVVHPYVLPARAAIDFTLPAMRIGDRDKPLSEKTTARIAAGLRKHATPITLEAAGHTFERRPGVRTWSLDHPLTVLHTSESKAIACPPFLTIHRGGPGDERTASLSGPTPAITASGNFLGIVAPPMLVPCGGGRNDEVTPVDVPMRTRMTREIEGVCTPPMLVPVEGRAEADRVRTVDAPGRAQTGRLQDALVVPLRNNGVARQSSEHPLPAFAAAGTHHALVMRNNTARGDHGHLSTPVDEPIRALTTAGHQSLIEWGGHSVYAYDTGELRPLGLPLPTQTTVEGDALLGRAIEVDDCTFRMLGVGEIRAGMAFADGFLMPYGSKRDRVRMLGNAVTPPAARDLVAALVEAITGDEIELAGVR